MILSNYDTWYSRRLKAEHQQWFRNLVDFHEITLGWLGELKIDRLPHELPRGVSPKLDKSISENLWMLNSLPSRNLNALLDDTCVDDTLARLEHALWAVQAWTLGHLLEKDARGALENLLEQVSWKLGRKCAEARWKGILRSATEDLPRLVSTLSDSPFAGYPHETNFLPQRETRAEVALELRTCPHQSPYPEIKPYSDLLCHLHTHWMRGFIYALNSKATVELKRGSHELRCTQRWFFIQ